MGGGVSSCSFREMLEPGFSSHHLWDPFWLLATVSGGPSSGVRGVGQRGILLVNSVPTS